MKKILLALFVFVSVGVSQARFQSKVEMSNVFRRVGVPYVVGIPYSSTGFTFHELRDDGSVDSQSPSALTLSSEENSEYSEILSYYDEEEEKAFEAFILTNTLVCFRTYQEAYLLTGSNPLGMGELHALNREWSHCFVFPRPIEEVVQSLSNH